MKVKINLKKELLNDVKIYLFSESIIKISKWLFVLFLGAYVDSVTFGILGIIKIYEDFFPNLLTYGMNIVQQKKIYIYSGDKKKNIFF